MRVKQSRRLLPGRLSCEHICVWRFEQTPMCLLRSHDCLSFLFSLPLKTRCPSSHSSHHGQERKGYSNPHWEQELHSWLWNIFTLRNKDLTIRSLEKKKKKKVLPGLFSKMRVNIEVWACVCVSNWVCAYAWLCVTWEPFAGACCLGTMVQPGAQALQRGLLLTTSHHR